MKMFGWVGGYLHLCPINSHLQLTSMKRQSVKLDNNVGSLQNYLMGNNSTLPVVGEGATILSYTDRRACEVISVSEDGKRVVLEGYNAIRTDKNGMSDEQEYRYELNGRQNTIVWRNGAWRYECEQIWFTDEALMMTYEDRQKCYDPTTNLPILVEGLTFVKKSYPKLSVIFGVKKAYHDYSF